jgi:hypothetical protein
LAGKGSQPTGPCKLLQMQPCWWRDLAVHAIIGSDTLTASLSLRMLQAVITYRQK